MATRVATFTAKIHTLRDYYSCIRHGNLSSPSGIDIANTLKYFSQTLLGVLKDVPSIPVELMRTKEQDHARLGLFPILDYKGLHHVVVQLLDIFPHIQQGTHVLGQSLLHLTVCLVPFLEHEYIDMLPNLVTSTLTTFPDSLHQQIIDTLCNHLLPFTIADDNGGFETRNYASLSIPAIIMTVFQYSNNQAHHCQLLECLMSLKRDIVKDIFCIIAHGTSVARAPAATLLFHYWPTLNPTPYDRRGMQSYLPGWKSMLCQRENCLSGENNEAVKLCLDPAIAIGTGDHPPPLNVCQGCADQIQMESDSCQLLDVLLPMQQISLTCENKNCRATERNALYTCFSMECASYNGNRPTRYCAQCHSIRHNNRRGGDHVVHAPIECPWDADPEMHMYVVEAIISLLKEAQPIADKNYKESVDQHIRAALLDADEQVDSNILEERRMLSRYGIYLLVGLCTPNETTPLETLGRLLAMLFQWFDATAYLKDDQAGSLLERLKSEFVRAWLMEVCSSHFEVFVSCLLPHPPDYARVGGHWDSVISRTGHIKEGFNRLFCLVPYEIINLEVWDYIMGHWMEAIRTEVPQQELPELKMLLSKVLDPEMSPLGFDAHNMYKFFAIRFHATNILVQEQALHWLQILCELDVVVPLSLIFSMFNDGISSIMSLAGSHTNETVKLSDSSEHQQDFCNILISNECCSDDMHTTSPMSADELLPEAGIDGKDDSEMNLPCFVLMLDVLLKQIELQEVTQHQGLEHIVSHETLGTVKGMFTAPWVGSHTCQEEDSYECIYCETCIIFYQLLLELLEYISPLPENTDFSQMAGQDVSIEESHNIAAHEDTHSKVENMPVKASEAAGLSMKELETRLEKHEIESLSALPLLTATVQTVADAELQTVAIIPTEEVVKAVAHAITLSETDVGSAKVSVVQATIVDENEQPLSTIRETTAEEQGNFWQTSHGKFKFTLDELPVSLQLIHLILKQELVYHEEADVLYYILNCLKVLCFRAECLTKASREHRGFLIWCQENLLLHTLWKQLQVEYSHVSQIAVQILLHCLTLPSGADTFWKIVEENFHSEDWKVRFAAVEKVTIMARFLDCSIVHHSSTVQSAMANVFSYLISSLDDVNPHVAERVALYLDTIQSSSMKCLCWCLEMQFDQVILDRPMILQTLNQLYNCLSDRPILSWEFFLNRFDTLFLEAQVNLEKSGDIVYPRDLKNTDTNSETFAQKLNRAHEAINQSMAQSTRSLSVSLGSKLRYKRAMSAPCGMTCRQDKLVDKEKLFSRQSSAPVLKRKSSKFGVVHLHHPLAAHFPNHLFPDGHLKDHSHDDQNFLSLFHRLMESEDHDQDTIHLLIFLLMQFLSQPEQAYPTDEKALAKTQNIVLRHLNLLLGYSPQEKGFCIPPSKMRNSPIFNAFLSNLPRVLDQNFKMATVLLPICIPVLLYCPAPLRSSTDVAHLGYSLWCLDSRLRLAWLQAVCVLVYKYRYNLPPLSKQVLSLARIILNTLSFHNHRCRSLSQIGLSSFPNLPQSREMSMISAGELCNIQERDTPPYSPRSTMEGVIVTITAPVEGKVHYQKMPVYAEDTVPSSESEISWKPRKLQDFAPPSDLEAEPELEAIPESPKTESPQGDSLQDSTGELESIDEPFPEKAQVRVESGIAFVEDELVIMNPPLEMATKTDLPVIIPTEDVEQHMAQQLQAFHQSFDKGRLGRGEPDKDSRGLCDNVLSQSIMKTEDSFASNSDDSDDTFLRQMTVDSDSVFIAKLVTDNSKKDLFANGQCGPAPLSTFTEEKKASTKFPLKKHPSAPVSGGDKMTFQKEEKLHKFQSVIPWEGSNDKAGITTWSKGSPLEVLDASRLENSVLRREPAIVSQDGKQTVPSYLFQPIHSHPLTKEQSKADGNAISQAIRVEPQKTLSIELPSLLLTSPKSAFSPKMPWTIEVHSPIKLEPMLPNVPSPERLLPIGPNVVGTPPDKHNQLTEGSEFEISDFQITERNEKTKQFNPELVEDATNLSEQQLQLQPLLEDGKKLSGAVGKKSDITRDSGTSLLNKMWQALDNLKPTTTEKADSSCVPLASVVIEDMKSSSTSSILTPSKHLASHPSLEGVIIDRSSLESELVHPGLVTATVTQVQVYEGAMAAQPLHSEFENFGNFCIQEPVILTGQGASPSLHMSHETDSGAVISHVSMRTQVESFTRPALKEMTIESLTYSHISDQLETLPSTFPCRPVPTSPLHSTCWVIGPPKSPVPACSHLGREIVHADEHLFLTDEHSLKKTSSPLDSTLTFARGMQRLHPIFRHPVEAQHKPGIIPCPSPRPLTKAFDSPLELLYHTNLKDVGGVSTEGPSEHEPSPFHFLEKHGHRHEQDENRGRGHFRQRRQRKVPVDPQKLAEIRNFVNRKSRKGDFPSGGSRGSSQLQGGAKNVEEVMVDRCPECGAALEQYSDEELGLCIVILATIIHREPASVATILPEILHTVARIASNAMYPWEMESSTYLPGNARSVARQFLRCVLHQLASSGVFLQVFQSTIDEPEFFKMLAMSLTDFNELNPTAPLQLLLEGLNEKKMLPSDNIVRILNNIAAYMDCLQLEISASVWANLLPQFDLFFRKLVIVLPSNIDVTPTLHILCCILHIQGLNSFKTILDPFSKIVAFAIQNCTFKYQTLLNLCHLCNRAFSKERDKLYVSRTVVYELVQAMKFKTNIPDENLLKLVQFIIQDAGGTLSPSIILEDIGATTWDVQNMINTSASECMRQYFAEALEFVADVHTLGKIKSILKGTMIGLNEDTLGGTLKAGIAQYLALEITRGNNRENRAIHRHLPWLYNPLPAVQQGPREFIDCVMHIRLLSWLLLGSLVHMVVVGSSSNLVCQPIPLEASLHVADHVQVILAGFAEQSKASVLHMSSLFHAFILCQLWTMYCEQLTSLNVPGSDPYHTASLTIIDFWAKVTPGILQLLSHSKVLAEMVTLHFLSLIEALIECNSTVLAKLFAMWRPVLNSYHNQLPGHLVVRLQACENRPPPSHTIDEVGSVTAALLKWVQRLQFKMGQIELQSSAATQFYSV